MDVRGTPRLVFSFVFDGSPQIDEKSPLRNATVGTVSLNVSSDDSLNRSRLKKKNVFWLPLVKNGIGPPNVPPKSCRRLRGRTRLPLPSFVKGAAAFSHSFTRYS